MKRYMLRAAERGKPCEVWRFGGCHQKREILIRPRRSPSTNSNSSHEGGRRREDRIPPDLTSKSKWVGETDKRREDGMGAFNHLLILLSGPILRPTNKWRG